MVFFLYVRTRSESFFIFLIGKKILQMVRQKFENFGQHWIKKHFTLPLSLFPLRLWIPHSQRLHYRESNSAMFSSWYSLCTTTIWQDLIFLLMRIQTRCKSTSSLRKGKKCCNNNFCYNLWATGRCFIYSHNLGNTTGNGARHREEEEN